MVFERSNIDHGLRTPRTKAVALMVQIRCAGLFGLWEVKTQKRCSMFTQQLPAGIRNRVAKVNQKVVGFCTVVRGSEQNSLAEIYIIPAFQGKKIGRRLWDSARQFIDQNNDTTVALLRLNTPAKKFYEGLGFAETGVSWEGENLKNEDGTTVIEMILRA